MTNPILVADDSAFDLDFALLALEKCDVPNPVVTVRDGEEALDYLFARHHYEGRAPGNPAVLILDLKMPKVDGLEVLRTVRADSSLASIPVIALTHSALPTDKQAAEKLGIDRYVVKPLEIKQFIVDICKAVSACTKPRTLYG